MATRRRPPTTPPLQHNPPSPYASSGRGFEGDEEGSLVLDAFACDHFRMYEFKVRRCARGQSHDWTECPYAHPGEKARRRDPRQSHYSGAACSDFHKGVGCKKGDACEFAHGVFECCLHPTWYRTQSLERLDGEVGSCCRCENGSNVEASDLLRR